MASLESIKKLHKNVGESPAHTISDTVKRWFAATTKYIAKMEQELSCSTQQHPKKELEASGTE
jgi:hypothetical protein